MSMSNLSRIVQTRLTLLYGFTVFVAARYRQDRASSIAAALAYTSLLSLVPLMAIALAMLAAFPVFGTLRARIEAWVFTNFVPSVGQVVQDQVGDFVANAGRLSAAGIVGLAVTAVMLLVTVETALNGIYRIDHARPALSRVLVYWTMLTLGPLLVGASLSIEGYLASLASAWSTVEDTAASTAGTMLEAMPVGGSYWAQLLPLALSIAALTAMFLVIPNRRVLTVDAGIGGLVGGVLFALLRWGFAIYVGSFGAYSSVYGAVAVVPIVLFWMFLSWVVVLIGAEITAALPEWRAGYAHHPTASSGERRFTLALETLWVLREAALSGSEGVTTVQLMFATTSGEAELLWVVQRLIDHHYTARTEHGRIVLSRDLAGVTLSQLVHDLDLGLGLDETIAPQAPWRARATPVLAKAHDGQHNALDIALAEVLSETLAV